MPIYHSSFNQYPGQSLCGTVILPIKTKVRGPAPQATNLSEKDIIDECIEYFRANVLHRNFKIEGPADLILCYLTAFITEVLRELTKYKTKSQARQGLLPLAVSTQFLLPGHPSFAFPGFFKQPDSPTATEQFKNYFRQLREETVNRLIDLVYIDDKTPAASAAATTQQSSNTGDASKWWIMFSKRKFMNIQKVT